MKHSLLLLALLSLAGCSGRDKIPFLGRWSGGFLVSKVGAGTQIRDPARQRLTGYLQIYATDNGYLMHLEGEQEAVDVKGTWDHKQNRLTLHPIGVKIDDQGGADQRDPNRPYIAAEDLRKAYGAPIPLRIDATKKRLEGLFTVIGPLQGTHVFTKDLGGH